MTHLDRDTLALVALAELELSAAEQAHLAACPACTGELDALRRTVLIGRSAGNVELIEPADAVWGRIHAALGFSDLVAAPPRLAEFEVARNDTAPGDLAADNRDNLAHDNLAHDNAAHDNAARDNLARDDLARDDLARDDLARDDLARDDLAPGNLAHDNAARDNLARDNLAPDNLARDDASGAHLTDRAGPGPGVSSGGVTGTPVLDAGMAEAAGDTAGEHAGPLSTTAAQPASVVQLDQRRRRAWLPVAAAACAVGLVGGIAGGAWWQSTRSPAAESVIAEAQLDALPGWTATGSAAVEELADGRREVVVDLADDAGADGLREVWLLTADATGLVSVGLLDGATGRFSLPAGIDLVEYPVVDVSAEPADGNPAHSGDSIVRGTLSNL